MGDGTMSCMVGWSRRSGGVRIMFTDVIYVSYKCQGAYYVILGLPGVFKSTIDRLGQKVLFFENKCPEEASGAQPGVWTHVIDVFFHGASIFRCFESV